MLIPSGGDHPRGLYEALREFPTDVLIIEPAATMANKPTFAATLLRRRRGTIEKTHCLRFWIDAHNACFLVPEEEGLAQRLLARGTLAQWLALWENLERLFTQAERASLDRKQVILTALDRLAAVTATRAV